MKKEASLESVLGRSQLSVMTAGMVTSVTITILRRHIAMIAMSPIRVARRRITRWNEADQSDANSPM